METRHNKIHFRYCIWHNTAHISINIFLNEHLRRDFFRRWQFEHINVDWIFFILSKAPTASQAPGPHTSATVWTQTTTGFISGNYSHTWGSGKWEIPLTERCQEAVKSCCTDTELMLLILTFFFIAHHIKIQFILHLNHVSVPLNPLFTAPGFVCAWHHYYHSLFYFRTNGYKFKKKMHWCILKPRSMLFILNVSGVCLIVPPDPPVVELKEVINNTISIVWTPGFEGDSPITGYCLEYKAFNGKKRLQ